VSTLAEPEIAAIHRIASRHGVERVRLFGSRARGQGHATSDVDLLIRLLPGHGFTDFMAFCEGSGSGSRPASGCRHRGRAQPLHPGPDPRRSCSVVRDDLYLEHILEAIERMLQYTSPGRDLPPLREQVRAMLRKS
jgi:nucleotidyltransferase-like protein